MYANFRLDFKNIPPLNQIGARVFSAAEFIYYPGNKDWRSSLNMGINFPLGQINISLYHTIATFGSSKGDIPRLGSINFSF